MTSVYRHEPIRKTVLASVFSSCLSEILWPMLRLFSLQGFVFCFLFLCRVFVSLFLFQPVASAGLRDASAGLRDEALFLFQPAASAGLREAYN